MAQHAVVGLSAQPSRHTGVADVKGPDRPEVDAEVRAGLPVLALATAQQFERWLASLPGDSKGLWLKLAKKGAGIASVTKQQAIEVALCHGWIDGQLNPYDEVHWLIRFTPRSLKSRWSAINRDTAMRLIAAGQMAPAGLAQVEAARRDGRWEGAYAPQSKATVPPDLQAALDANPAAKRFFSQLTGANRYAVLYRIQDAGTQKTRELRVQKFVKMLECGEVMHPPRRKLESPS